MTLHEEDTLFLEEEDRLEGKYFCFELGNQAYAFPMPHVWEVTMPEKISAMPDTPHFVRGVMTLRDEMLPVVDLRTRLGLPPAEEGQEKCLVVIQGREEKAAVLIDRALGVHALPPDAVAEPPALLKNAAGRFLSYLGRDTDGVKMILNVEKLLDHSA